MNKSKFFGSRPVLYFMAEGEGSSGGSGSGGGEGTSGAGAGAGGGESAAPISDEQFLSQGGEKTAIVPADKGKEKEAAAGGEKSEEIVKLDKLEEGDPEWYASVTDAKAAAAVRQLLQEKKEYAEHFKTPAELKEFFKDLPGGRDQVSALLTLGKEVGELDTAIEGADFTGHLSVAERVLNQAPENALSLTRAWAQAVAKSQPEVWQQASTEMVNLTLKAAGIGADLVTVLGAIKEMRAAVAADDAQAFGTAASKLLGEPKAEAKEDPLVVKARTDAATAAQERDKALATTWNNTVNNNVEAVETMLKQDIGKKLSDVLADSTKQETRDKLAADILKEVDSQMGANAWLRSQIQALVGSRQQMNLRASAEDFAKALELSKGAARPLVNAAVRKVVSAWAKEQAANNEAARNKAKGAAATKDVGGSSAAKANGKGVITEDMVRDRNLSDEELLSKF